MNLTKVNPTIFKQWAIDTVPAARAVLMARLHAQMERARVDAYVRPIFDSYKFEYASKFGETRQGLIADPAHLYLCDDEPMVAAYFEECDKAHRAHGFTGPHGHCPALRAESLAIAAENALIELARSLFGIESHQLTLELRERYLELLIGGCLAADKERK